MALSPQWALMFIRTKFKLLSLISKRKAAVAAFHLFCTPQHRNKKELPPIFVKAERLQFSFLQYTVQGYRWNTGAGKKALILHGFESSVVNFDRYVNPLLKKGYEVLAFDAPAHGRSSGTRFNALLYKELIQTIYKNHGPIQSFISHSLGGLALSLALEDMVHDETTKAVFIAPATETITAVDMFFDFVKLDKGLRPYFDNVIVENSGHEPGWFSVARAIKGVKATILWAHDKDDTMTPYADIQNVMNAHYPNITFFITKGLGHRRIYRDSAVAKKVIDFL
ncbi:MAG TPA: alpha/beta hydrolase family protein [Chitinophagaceae bacterium]|nr:alpha/beta hydrolase family protein [Chitinophagaceae bacterium]